MKVRSLVLPIVDVYGLNVASGFIERREDRQIAIEAEDEDCAHVGKCRSRPAARCSLLGVPGHQVGVSRLIGGRPPSEVGRR
jgi:hypothetical protein